VDRKGRSDRVFVRVRGSVMKVEPGGRRRGLRAHATGYEPVEGSTGRVTAAKGAHKVDAGRRCVASPPGCLWHNALSDAAVKLGTDMHRTTNTTSTNASLAAHPPY
jgi:hypothetical protein